MKAMATIIFALFIASLQPALAAKRVALVIGNSAYQNVTRLANPGNDSDAMSAMLGAAGFDVVDLKRDLNANAMRRALRDFADIVRDADVAIVYYAGHGIEIDGTNYLIPVDAVLERDIDAYDEAVSLDRLLMLIDPARQLRLVILDACRDNPFGKSMKRTIATRAVGRGLARVEPNSSNTLIAFAARAGSTASDGDGKYSPFTSSLLKYLTLPGLDVRKALGFARDEVLKATNHRQEPFVYGSLGGEDFPLVPAPPAAPTDPDAAVRRAYELALQVGTAEIWDSFITNYPKSFYTDLAGAQRRKSAAAEQVAEQLRVAAEKQKALDATKVAEAERTKAATQTKADEDARNAAEKAAANARAAADAKAEQEARVATEKKAREDAKAAEAQRAKAAIQAKVGEDAAADAKAADEKKGPEDKTPGKLAALVPQEQPGDATAKADKPAAQDIPRLLQTELRRVGCITGNIDGSWTAAAQKALGLFNKHAGTTLDVRAADLDALDLVRGKTGRICPLICDHGYRADGNRCAKIACGAGFVLDDDNECKKKHEGPAVQRSLPKPGRMESGPASPPASATGSYDPSDISRRVTMGGSQTCGQRGCQIVPKGCQAIRGMGGHGLGGKIFCP